ncbi:M90 family metallopeptidase [Salinisphaera aquimarina]|uniref:Zinc-dependent peptidase n=1 Tax=Salinisphaera aquimarina TaxID=2094031 RepID=A0ABV7EPM3_9GAMM
MNIIAAILVIAGALAAAASIMAYPRLRRRWRKPAQLTAAEQRLLLERLPWRDLLTARQRDKLLRLSARLLADVRFVGCGGLVLTGEMQLVVASQASLLCLGAQPAEFALPGEILIYPDAFYIPRDLPDEHGLVDDLPLLAAGEAWQEGRVVLSWSDIRQALAGAADNVVLHEFAHLLDFAAPDTEGAPPMAGVDSWSGPFSRAFDTLRAQGSPVIDIYGAESPAEFFAVAVEAFFQRGAELADAHPDLHAVMAAYFDLDTARCRPHFTDAQTQATPR